MKTPGTITEARAGYVDAFEHAARAPHGGVVPEWLGKARREAIRRFEEIGFPGPRNEDWKYTSVASLAAVPFADSLASGRTPGADADVDVRAVERLVAGLGVPDDAVLAVVVNGRFAAPFSRTAASDVFVRGLAEDLSAADSLAAGRFGKAFETGAHGFAALNTAFAADGVVVRVARGASPQRPVHVVFVSAPGQRPTTATTRSLVVCDRDSALTLVEHHAGEAGVHLSNAGVEIALARGAALRHVKVQNESADAYHVARTEVDVDEGAAYHSHVITLGAALSRNEIVVRLSGPRAECRLWGLYALSGKRHADHHTWVDHRVADTKSFETYKGVIDGESRGVFTGHVLVRRDSQRIEARQTNKNLLLSDSAVVETRPQLEIYADDVQCSHGAAIGKLDQEATFYLRQRGLDPAAARTLLTWAFADEVIAALPYPAVRASVGDLLHRRLSGTFDATTIEEVAR